MKYLLFLLFPTILPAQGAMHDNNWVFGHTSSVPGNTSGTLIHFEHGYPEFSAQNLVQDYDYYAITCSDSMGKLLFHTNGIRLRNWQHTVMENGEVINPGELWEDFQQEGYPSVTGGMAVPAPGKNNFYYLIHTTSKDGDLPGILCPELLYSLIDMNANGGLGKVVEVNQVLGTGDLPSPVLVKHGNGRDWWVVVGDYVSKTYLIYLIDPTGIHQSHQQSIAAPSLTNQSYADVSPDGKFIVVNDDNTGLWVFDFDRCTGLMSNTRVLPYSPPQFFTASLAFSPDGRFLYPGTHLNIFQLDMQTIDSAKIAFDTVARYEFGSVPAPPFYTHFFLPELAPDGKVYYGTFNDSRAVHVMNRPKLPLFASDFSQRQITLPQHNAETRWQFPHYRLGALQSAVCDTLEGLASTPIGQRPLPPPRFIRSEEQPKVLRLPEGFSMPKSMPGALPEDYNPLNMKSLFRKRLEERKKAQNAQKE